MLDSDFEYDAFISHATEDKASFVEGLAIELQNLGLQIWFDKFSLKVGDSLRRSIEEGLSKSRFGIVIFSPSFFAKNWTQAELNGLFAMEMGGRKVILPVWHQISSEEMRKNAPIQSDKFALRSSDGVLPVARALVEVMRPELLTLDASMNRAKQATSHLRDELEKKYPGYSVRISSVETLTSSDLTNQKSQDIVISKSHGEMRIDVLIADAGLVKSNPPHIDLAFHGEGISKIEELIRTGKPQRFLDGEFSYRGGNMPLISEGGFPEGTQLETRNVVKDSRPLDVRLIVSAEKTNLEIPILHMRPTRAGTDEGEIVLSHHASPLTITMTISSQPGDRDLNLSTSFKGFTFAQIFRSMQIANAILNHGELSLVNIVTGKLIFNGRLDKVVGSLYPGEIATLVEMVKTIEAYFGIDIYWPDRITEEDFTVVNLLNCLINGEEYGSNLSAELAVVFEQSIIPSLVLMLQGPVLAFQESPRSREGFTLLGHRIATEPWGFHTEQMVIEDPEVLRAWLATAHDGESLSIRVKGISPTFAKWKSALNKVQIHPALRVS